MICAKTSEVIECAPQPATSLALAAFRSGSHDWEQGPVFSSDMRQRDRRTDKAELLVFLFKKKKKLCPRLCLSAARCPPPASISIASKLVLSPLTYMASRNEAKLPLEPPLGAPSIFASLRLPLPASASKHGSFWKITHCLSFTYSQDTLVHLVHFQQVLVLWLSSLVRLIVISCTVTHYDPHAIAICVFMRSG